MFVSVSRQASQRLLMTTRTANVGVGSVVYPCTVPAALAARFASTTTDPTPKKETRTFVQRLYDRYSIKGQQRRIHLAERLFRSAYLRAMDPRWYGPGRIGRDFRSRHAMVTMHVWFLHKRLISDETDPHFSLMVQEELFDTFWNDTQSRIRAEKVPELTVSKHLKDVQQVTFQHLTHYDHTYTEHRENVTERFKELSILVWVHILLRDEDVFDDQLKRLSMYIEANYENMVELTPDEYFFEGRIQWIDIPDFTNMRDRLGKKLPDLEVDPDDILPDGWHKVLTDSGEPFYWHPENFASQWEKPV